MDDVTNGQSRATTDEGGLVDADGATIANQASTMETSGRSTSGVDAAVATAEATLAAALEALRIATDSIDASTTTKAAAALASAAVKDLSPSDLDEIRAIRSSPPIIVQQVVCCVCSILGCSDEDATATAPVAAATGSGLLPLMPAEGVPRATAGGAAQKWRNAVAQAGRGAKGVVPWELAQKRVGRKGFKQALLSFDARRLLTPEAAAVLDAVRCRIAVEAPAVLLPSEAGLSRHTSSGLITGRLAAAPVDALEPPTPAGSLAGSPTEPPPTEPPQPPASQPLPALQPLPASRSSLASVASRARRASRDSSTADGGALPSPLTWEDASFGSRTIGALFLWCSRVLASVEGLRASEEAEVRRRREAELEATRWREDVAAAEASLAGARAAHALALEEERRERARGAALAILREEEERRRAAAAEATAAAEAARRRQSADVAARRAKAAEAAAEVAAEAAAAERIRQQAMRAADETERQRREEELERRREAGTRAVLEVVDIVIHQKLTFTVRTASARPGPTPWAAVRLPCASRAPP